MKHPSVHDRILARQEPQDKIIVMHHEWRDLLFLHWEYDPVEIQKTLPQGLQVDTFNGKAYIGLTPFTIHNLRFSILPPLPGVSDFSEVNVRTYVYDEYGTPGVWFYSLDADNIAAVEAANLIHLPYRHADINTDKDPGTDTINFFVKRTQQAGDLSSSFIYKSGAGIGYAESETLEFFLIERYILFTWWEEKSKLKKIQVHHPPYELKNAEVFAFDTNLLLLDGFELGNSQPDHLIYSPGVDVKIYQMEDVRRLKD